jgi:gas vesicle protein GvpN
MKHGHTLVYDEFTRSSAKANGILLSVLEEGVLISTNQVNGRTYLQAHPDFRIILTSNPHDYAGVNSTPDALLDRMVTFNLGVYSLETKTGIVSARTGLSPEFSARIVRLVSKLQTPAAEQTGRNCSMRASILIARIAAMRLSSSTLSDALLAQITADVLNGRGPVVSASQIAKQLAVET